MPSDTRSTEQRTFSIAVEASEGIDEYAAENNMSKSMVVETAVLDYLEQSQADQIEEKVDNVEEKVDEVLAKLDGSSNPSPSSSQTSGEKENVGTGQSDFDPEAYDPDADRERPLSKEQVKELITLEEPELNPDHITDDSISMNADPKATSIAAIIRYEGEGYVHTSTIKNGYIEEYVGSTSYLLDTYTEAITSNFPPVRDVQKSDDEKGYSLTDTGRWFTTRETEIEHYQKRLDAIEEAVNTPVYEMPDFGYYQTNYEHLKRWLAIMYNNRILQEFGLITTEKFNELLDGLNTHIQEVDECLDLIRGLDTGYGDVDFKREDAVDAFPYDESESEELYNLFAEWAYVGEWGSEYKDCCLIENNIIR